MTLDPYKSIPLGFQWNMNGLNFILKIFSRLTRVGRTFIGFSLLVWSELVHLPFLMDLRFSNEILLLDGQHSLVWFLLWHWQKFRKHLYDSGSMDLAINDQNDSAFPDQLAVVFRREGGVNLLSALLFSYIPYDYLSKTKYG